NPVVPMLIDIMSDTTEDNIVIMYAYETLESFIEFKESPGEPGSWSLEDYMKLKKLVEKINMEDSVPRLIKILSDNKEDIGIRRYASDLLGMIGDRRAIEPTIKVYNEKVAWGALKLLKKTGDSRLAKIMDDDGDYGVWAWTEEKEKAIGVAMDVLRGNPLPKLLSEEKIREDEREHCSHMLWSKNKSDKYIEKSIERKRKEYAIKVLSEAKAKEAVTMLIELLERERETSIVSALISSLGEIGDERAVELIVKCLHDEKFVGAFVEFAAIEALGNIGGKIATETLEEILYYGDYEPSQTRAAKALKKITGKEYKYKR
ncbi:MAG: HEAT repeat domain-containing protein, partial [Candidatus Desantisbacteria bacterium]